MSESDDDIPDGPPVKFQPPGARGHGNTGGINLREAMALAKLPPISVERDDEVKGEIVEPCPPEPHPSVGVVNGRLEDGLSDWDDEEEEEEEVARPHPLPLALDHTHIPAVMGASREPSGVQSVRMGGGEGVRGAISGEVSATTVPEAAMERSKVSSELKVEVEDSILSSESESDLPMFGGYTPSAGTTSRQHPIRQGLTPPVTTPPIERKFTPTLTPTSPTVVTPLSITAGIYTLSDSSVGV